MTRTKLLAFSLIPLLGLVAIVEIGLRLGRFDFEVRTLEVEAKGERAAEIMKAAFSSDYFVPDRRLFWRPRPGRDPFNSKGYRGPEVPKEKAAGELRILAVGDSNTLGHAATWVDALPTSVDPKTLGRAWISTINVGVYGYTSHQGKIRLEEFLPFSPDVVLISFGGNDSTPNAFDDETYGAALAPPVWTGKLRILDAVWYAASRLRRSETSARKADSPPPSPPVPRVSLDAYGKNLEAMIERVESIGAKPILLTRPFAVDFRSSSPGSPTVVYRDKTFEVGRARGVAVIDVDAIAGHLWSLYDDHSHFNEKGHKIVGERIGRAINTVLAGQPLAIESLAYVPSEPYEIVMSDLKNSVNTWATLEVNKERLLAEGRISNATPIWSADLSGKGEPLEILNAIGAPEHRDGHLVLRAPPNATASVYARKLPRNDDYGWIWIDTKSVGATSIRLYWSTGEPFHGAASISAAYYDANSPRSFSHLVPPGVTSLRIDFGGAAEPVDVEIARIVLMRVPRGATKPRTVSNLERGGIDQKRLFEPRSSAPRARRFHA